MDIKRIEIEINDDGSFQIEAERKEPPRKEEKGGAMVCTSYDQLRKKYSAADVGGLQEKIAEILAGDTKGKRPKGFEFELPEIEAEEEPTEE